ncbi:NAD-dependent epimerase/dehydratase family protein [Sphingosinithalassobacter portus]|uniref:NAD-dependent epimerase/dehydratase family protein n=1 Tax=Stakelama portus TaxID=2676234 RepID=UPI000D6DF3A1|nr:NAD-dependent epimerase/dehydratase family protein [Sphingosinithalassobacter portus]
MGQFAPLPPLAETLRFDPAAREAIAADTRRIIVVGAGGWIGRMALAGLHDALGEAAMHRRVVAFGSATRGIDIGLGRCVTQHPLHRLGDLPEAPTMLLHLAFLTKDKAAGMAPDAYCVANRALSKTVLGALDRIGVDRLFLASSGAAAHAADVQADAALRLYGALKAEDEARFGDWARAGEDRRAVIARIFNLSGPFINKHQTYALASFIRDALAHRPIEVRAPVRVVRSYVALRELLSLVLVKLMAEQCAAVTRFDSGGTPVELGEVAVEVASRFGTRVARQPLGDGQANIYAGDGDGYARLLERYGITPVPFPDQIAETASFLAAYAE